jgi:hypothetical protein
MARRKSAPAPPYPQAGAKTALGDVLGAIGGYALKQRGDRHFAFHGLRVLCADVIYQHRYRA